MKQLSLSILIAIVGSCSGQTPGIPDQVPYYSNPPTPPQELLEQVGSTNVDELQTEQKTMDQGRRVNYYHLNGKLYSGWARQIFEDTEHKYRYIKFEKGLPVWQIGYYANGQLDHDFHMKDGKNLGSSRMWMNDGKPYIDTYFSEPGVQHGPQKRWHSNGRLARDALFDHDSLVYEILFDKNGDITESKGAVPDH